MCNASINATETREATIHDQLQLVTDTVGQPYFHRFGDETGMVTCILPGSSIRVTGISAAICAGLGISHTIEGVFAQDPTETDDAIWLGGDTFISLCELVSRDPYPTVKLLQSINCSYLHAFRSACKRYFSGPREAMARAWGFPFLDDVTLQSNVTPATVELIQYPMRLTFDRLPAIVHPDGLVSYPGTGPIPEHSQIKPRLEDAWAGKDPKNHNALLS